MDREVIKQIIADQRDYKTPKVFFNRSQITKIEDFANEPSIIILVHPTNEYLC